MMGDLDIEKRIGKGKVGGTDEFTHFYLDWANQTHLLLFDSLFVLIIYMTKSIKIIRVSITV